MIRNDITLCSSKVNTYRVARDAEIVRTLNLKYACIIYLSVAGFAQMLRISLTQQPVLRGTLSHANRVSRGLRH